jgi:hypothetical protein
MKNQPATPEAETANTVEAILQCSFRLVLAKTKVALMETRTHINAPDKTSSENAECL